MDEHAEQVLSLKDGEVVFREGDHDTKVYLIVSGNIQISREVRHIGQVLASLGPGQFFGEMAMFGHQRSATAAAVGHARLLCMTKEQFLLKTREEPSFCMALIEDLRDRLRSSSEVIYQHLQEVEEIQEDLADVLVKLNVTLANKA